MFFFSFTSSASFNVRQYMRLCPRASASFSFFSLPILLCLLPGVFSEGRGCPEFPELDSQQTFRNTHEPLLASMQWRHRPRLLFSCAAGITWFFASLRPPIKLIRLFTAVAYQSPPIQEVRRGRVMGTHIFGLTLVGTSLSSLPHYASRVGKVLKLVSVV